MAMPTAAAKADARPSPARSTNHAANPPTEVLGLADILSDALPMLAVIMASASSFLPWATLGAAALAFGLPGIARWQNPPARATRIPAITATGAVAVLAIIVLGMGLRPQLLWGTTVTGMITAAVLGAWVMLCASAIKARGQGRPPALASLATWTAAMAAGLLLRETGPTTIIVVLGAAAPLFVLPWLWRLSHRPGRADGWVSHAMHAGIVGVVAGAAIQLVRLAVKVVDPGLAATVNADALWWASMPVQATWARHAVIEAVRRADVGISGAPAPTSTQRTWLRPAGLAISMAAMLATVVGRITDEPGVILIGAAWLTWIIAMVWRAESAARNTSASVIAHDGPARTPRRLTVRMRDSERWIDAELAVGITETGPTDWPITTTANGAWEVAAPPALRGYHPLPLLIITANHRGGLTRTRWRWRPDAGWAIHPAPRTPPVHGVVRGQDAGDDTALAPHRPEQGWSGIAWKISARRDAWWRSDDTASQRWSADERQDADPDREARLERLAGTVFAAPPGVLVSITLADGTVWGEPVCTRRVILRHLAAVGISRQMESSVDMHAG